MNDLVRDLDLQTEAAELFGLRLQEDHLLASNTTFSRYKNPEDEFLSFFEQTESLVYCTDVPKLMKTLGLNDYNVEEFHLFIDSCKRS